MLINTLSRKILLVISVYLIAAVLFYTPAKAYTDYSVDWPSSNAREHTLRIEIDGCVSLFKIKTENLDKFAKSQTALQEVLKAAQKRAENGCKNVK